MVSHGVWACLVPAVLLACPSAHGFPVDAPLNPNGLDHASWTEDTDDYTWLAKNLDVMRANILSTTTQENVTGTAAGHQSTLARCLLCQGVMTLLQRLMSQQKYKDKFGELAAFVCVHLHIEDADVCHGIIHMFQSEVTTVLDRLALRPSEVCGLVLGPSCGHPYDPYNVWNITFPGTPKPPVVTPTAPKEGLPTLRVLQISDIHMDFDYKPGSNADCHRPVCCRRDSGPVVGKGAGKWGDYRKCDSPPWLLTTLFQHLAKTHKFDLIYWTGDLPGHDVWNQSRRSHEHLMGYLTDQLHQHFPDTPVYPSLGNHEGVPVNSFPPPFIRGNDSVSWLYKTFMKSWSKWLPQSTTANISRGGFYTVLLQPGWRLVSLNMNYCNNQNWWLLLNTTDPATELHWLIHTLQAAEDAKEKVHIIGHIPPGTNDCLKAWSWNYYKIINRYENTVVAQFFGHTHFDSLEMFYDEHNLRRPLGVAYVAPSVTPYQGLNPGYRVYTVDGKRPNSTWMVLDHETYIMNLTQANQRPTEQPQWSHAYSAKKLYRMSGLLPQDWNNWIQRLNQSDAMLQQYYRLYYKLNPPAPSCDHSCKQAMLCQLSTGRSHDPSLCAVT